MPKVSDHWHEVTDSSNILGCGVKNGRLRVRFYKTTKAGTSTGLYQYETKDLGLCCQMAEAPSKGSFFREFLSDLPYRKIGT